MMYVWLLSDHPSRVQQSQRSFSRFGVKARGDTSEWTDTPAERAARAANGGLMPGAAGPLLIKGSEWHNLMSSCMPLQLLITTRCTVLIGPANTHRL